MRQLTRPFPDVQKLISVIQLLALIALLAMTVLACAPIRHTPFGEQVDSSFSNLNGASVSLLPALPLAESGKVQFSIFTDSHANYDDLSRVVKDINQSSSMFAVNLGDMTDLGLAIEYEAFASQVSKLKKPLFSVIGNHDAIGSGKAIYQKLFGAYDYYFDLNGVRFIYFNNNSLDFYSEGIDLDWLQRTVSQSPYPVLIFQHVDPLNEQYFSPAQKQQILEILDPEKVIALFHGHNHKFRSYEISGVLIQQVARVQGDQYSKIQIGEGLLKINNCQIGGSCETVLRTYGNILQ